MDSKRNARLEQGKTMSLIAPLLETPHTFAIVGVSQNRSKYGYELFETLTRHGHSVLPINPKYTEIDGQACYPSLAELPLIPDIVITAAPASASAQIAETCASLGFSIFWMPTGTESDTAIETCQRGGVTPIHGYCPVFLLKLPPEKWAQLP